MTKSKLILSLLLVASQQRTKRRCSCLINSISRIRHRKESIRNWMGKGIDIEQIDPNLNGNVCSWPVAAVAGFDLRGSFVDERIQSSIPVRYCVTWLPASGNLISGNRRRKVAKRRGYFEPRIRFWKFCSILMGFFSFVCFQVCMNRLEFRYES